MGAPSLEGLALSQRFGNQVVTDQQNQQKMMRDNQEAVQRQQYAKQASEQMKNGDNQGAYTTLMQDPNFAAQQGGEVGKIGYGYDTANDAEQGKLDPLMDSGNDPRSIQELKNQGLKDKASASSNKPTLFVGEDGLHHVRIGEVDHGPIMGPDGQPTVPEGTFNPKQQKDLKPFISDFQKQANKFDETLNGGMMFQQLVDGNLPGSKLPAIMKFLTSEEGVKRFNSDEFHEMGRPGDIADQVQQAIQQRANGKPWTPQQQQYMTQVAQTMEMSTINSYIDKIQSSGKGAAAATGVAQDRAEALMAASAHPEVKKHWDTAMKGIKADPDPEAAREAVDWARHNFQDPDAKAILQHYGF